LRCVYSIGLIRDPASGGGEAEALPEWFLQVAVFLFDNGVPWSAAVDQLPSSCSQLDGAAVHVFPTLDFVGRRNLAKQESVEA
jgi:hypothetical protein